MNKNRRAPMGMGRGRVVGRVDGAAREHEGTGREAGRHRTARPQHVILPTLLEGNSLCTCHPIRLTVATCAVAVSCQERPQGRNGA